MFLLRSHLCNFSVKCFFCHFLSIDALSYYSLLPQSWFLFIGFVIRSRLKDGYQEDEIFIIVLISPVLIFFIVTFSRLFKSAQYEGITLM